MTEQKLDFSALIKANNSFAQSLDVWHRYQGKSNDDALLNTLQAGVIQHFEFTYELCWKFLKRWFERNLGRSEVEGISRRELFRLAHEWRFIDDVKLWMTFHGARNQTSHTYEQTTADDVLKVAIEFLPQAQEFLERLLAHND